MKSNMKRIGLILATALLMLFGTLNAALAWTLSGTVYGGSNPLASFTVTLHIGCATLGCSSVSTSFFSLAFCKEKQTPC